MGGGFLNIFVSSIYTGQGCEKPKWAAISIWLVRLMDEPYLRYLSHPKLETPVFVEGLPGFGNVGKIAARLLIESSRAELFAELYSPFFPDYVIVGKSGICRPPRYAFYASSMEKSHLIVLTGDAQPSEDVELAPTETPSALEQDTAAEDAEQSVTARL